MGTRNLTCRADVGDNRLTVSVHMTGPDTTFKPNVQLVDNRDNNSDPFISIGANNWGEKDGNIANVALYASLDRAAAIAGEILDAVNEMRQGDPSDLEESDLDALANAS